MSDSIHDRLDREAKRLRADQTDSVTRVSDSFINGVEHAANIAYRAETGSYKGAGVPKAVDVTITHDDANRIFQALHTEANRLRVASDKKVSPEAINHAIELAEKSRQWLLSMTEPIEGAEQ